MTEPQRPNSSRGRQCAVYGCYNFQLLADGSKSDIHFFSVPQSVLVDKRKRDRWCCLIKRQHGRDGFEMSKNTRICHQHFLKDQIKVSLVNKIWTLKQGVEPCAFSWNKAPVGQRKAPTQRIPLSTLSMDSENLTEPGDGIDDEKPNRGKEMVTSHCTQTEVSTKEMGTQTSWEHVYENKLKDEHCYSFYKFEDAVKDIGSNDTLRHQIETLEEDLKKAKTKISELKAMINFFEENRFSIEKIRHDNDAMSFYTGFQNYGVFIAVYEYLENKAARLQYWRGQSEQTDNKQYQIQGGKPGKKRKLSLKDEFFMVLIRLKVGLFVKDIADRFEISVSQFSKIFTTWINFLHHELPLLFPFPSQEKIRQNMPDSFKQYPTTRIILDCTEVFVEIPSSMTSQSQTWSNYKHHNTFKVLVGVSPNGTVTFVSDLWGGRVSDKEITKRSGVLDLLDSGDNVMADKGFDIGDILPKGVTLNIPPFKLNKQLSSAEVEETIKIATVRIHVEREIGRIKNYHILDGVLPLSLSHIAGQIFKVISYLTCFLPPLVEPGSAVSKECDSD
ncbi:uncharacterized protein LOC123554226 isoform X2 [Mercenaria mercenaria]|nr:uncharacterized protein LOC123554226 isoform X2 [Mercenaria mercenaria]